jgi:hypothetical protein
MAQLHQFLVYIAIAIAVVFGLVLLVIALKGRRIPGEHVFQASRWSSGNAIFPAQVAVTPASITLYRPHWIGKTEESIHMAHVASIKIITHFMFADVVIESSGGQDPILCHGHTKGDAIAMKNIVEEYQSEYYKGEGPKITS